MLKAIGRFFGCWGFPKVVIRNTQTGWAGIYDLHPAGQLQCVYGVVRCGWINESVWVLDAFSKTVIGRPEMTWERYSG